MTFEIEQLIQDKHNLCDLQFQGLFRRFGLLHNAEIARTYIFRLILGNVQRDIPIFENNIMNIKEKKLN
ncbi:hypothetical protein DLK05_02220 [Ancylomarina longa]|uniref:Uncharacterized protein n=1 Tax=Ancylomarina longa TaxID=2487017 RepID=A0A434AY87_9BACT|nr:hypothetical protein DLK05_02220 [Ancylomarina longa]